MPSLGELQPVADQVEQDLTQAVRVADDALGQVRGEVETQQQPALLGLGVQSLDHLLQERNEVEGHLLQVHLPALDLAEVEDVVDDVQERLARGEDRLCVVVLLDLERCVAQELGQAHDAVDGCANLVAHVGQEEALAAVRLLGLVLGHLELARALADLLLELVEAHLRLLGQAPLLRQRVGQLTHLGAVEGLLEDQELLGAAQAPDDLLPGVVAEGRADHHLHVRVHLPDVLDRLEPVPARGHAHVDEGHADRLAGGLGAANLLHAVAALARVGEIEAGGNGVRCRRAIAEQLGLEVVQIGGAPVVGQDLAEVVVDVAVVVDDDDARGDLVRRAMHLEPP